MIKCIIRKINLEADYGRTEVGREKGPLGADLTFLIKIRMRFEESNLN